LACWCLTTLSAQISYIVPWAHEIHIVATKINHMKEKIHANDLFHLDFVEVIFAVHKVVMEVSQANHLASTGN